MKKDNWIVITVLALILFFSLSVLSKLVDRFWPEKKSTKISTVISDAVSGNVTTEVEVNKDGIVKVYTNEVELTAKRDIRQGEKFKVDLGVHTISTPVQFSNTTAWIGATTNGLAVGLALNERLVGGITYGLFTGLGNIYSRRDGPPLIVGLNLGYYWAINKQCFIGYDFISGSTVLGIGVRW